jgi:hypothetical protein
VVYQVDAGRGHLLSDAPLTNAPRFEQNALRTVEW